MKKKVMIRLFIIVGLLISILLVVNIRSMASLKALIISPTKDLKGGQEVTITLKFDEYKEIKEGINAYKAILEYSDEIFEEVGQEKFICQNDWENLKYNKQTKEFVAIKKAGTNTPEDVVTITLKVKEGAKATTTDIKIKDIVTSEGEKDIPIEETKITINIIEEQIEKPDPDQPDPDKPDPDQPDPDKPDPDQPDPDKPDPDKPDPDKPDPDKPDPDQPKPDQPKPDQPKQEKITSEKYQITEKEITKVLPETTVAEFKQNVKLENVTTEPQMVFSDNNGNTLQENDIITTGTKVKIGNTLQYSLIVRGDINGDGKVDIIDLAELKLHLISKKLLEGIKLKAADIDVNNEIEANDLAQMKLVMIDLLKLK